MSNTFTSLNRSADPLGWMYHSEFGTAGSRVEISNVRAVYCMRDVLTDLGINHEVLQEDRSDSVLSVRDTLDGKGLDTWTVYDVELASTKLYNRTPESNHPLLANVKEEDIYAEQEKYEEGRYIIKIPQYSMLLDSAGKDLIFITEPRYFDKVDLICKHVSKLIFYPPMIPSIPERPKVNLVGRSNDGQFFSTTLRLPANPVTDDMLRDCYDVEMGTGNDVMALDGYELMTDTLEKLIDYEYTPGIDIYPNKGLYIIHGEPGTGKSKILTELLLRLEAADDDRDVYYFPPQAIDLLGAPEFMTWLYARQGAIIIAEDAESVLRASEVRSAATSNILNITDGLLGDALQITIIATFNCDISDLDTALLRPGRLKMAANFKRLTSDKALDAYRTILRDKYGIEEADIPSELPVKADTYSLAELYEMMPDFEPVED